MIRTVTVKCTYLYPRVVKKNFNQQTNNFCEVRLTILDFYEAQLLKNEWTWANGWIRIRYKIRSDLK